MFASAKGNNVINTDNYPRQDKPIVVILGCVVRREVHEKSVITRNDKDFKAWIDRRRQ